MSIWLLVAWLTASGPVPERTVVAVASDQQECEAARAQLDTSRVSSRCLHVNLGEEL